MGWDEWLAIDQGVLGERINYCQEHHGQAESICFKALVNPDAESAESGSMSGQSDKRFHPSQFLFAPVKL